MADTERRELLDIDVPGGALRVARWAPASPVPAGQAALPAHGLPDQHGLPAGQAALAAHGLPGGQTVLAAHGITASHAAWRVVAGHLRDEVTVIAPDLRGRGGSGGLPGPYGMAAHARDLLAVADALGVRRAVVAGHSMGGFVATTVAAADPDRVRGLVLVDGGLPSPTVTPDLDPDEAAELILGPALQRLRMTFGSRGAYRDFWRRHPAFEGQWSPAVQAYVDYDLEGEPGALRSKVDEGAVRADFRDMLENPRLRDAPARARCPIVFLRAPRGLRNEPPGLYPGEVVRAIAERLPGLRTQDIPGANHYTILLSDPPAARVAEHIREMVRTSSGRR